MIKAIAMSTSITENNFFGDKIRHILKEKGLSLAELSRRMNVNYRVMFNYISGTSNVTLEILQKFSSALEIHPAEILGGWSMPSSNNHEEEFAKVPIYDVRASAGYGITNNDEETKGHLAFSRTWIKKRGLRPDKLGIITVRGDSMVPVLNEGDLILVNHEDKTPSSGKPFVMRIGNEILVKFAQMTSKGLIANSANSVYQPMLVDNEDVEIIGKVVCSMREW